MGWDTGYKFLSELVSMVDGETGDPELDEDFDEDEYDQLATKLFSEWGVYGFGLDVYRDKPMLKTEDGRDYAPGSPIGCFNHCRTITTKRESMKSKYSGTLGTTATGDIATILAEAEGSLCRRDHTLDGWVVSA